MAGRGHQALSQDSANAQLGADVVAMQTDGAGPDPVTLARTCDFTFGRCHYASNSCQ